MTRSPRTHFRRSRSGLLITGLVSACLTVGLAVGLAALGVLGRPAAAEAHEIPERVAITLLLRPVEDRVQLLVRVPLEAMRDVDFPERADGALDLPQAGPLIAEAIGVWLVPGVQLFEDGRALPEGTVRAARLSLPGDRSWGSFDEALAHVRDDRLADSATVRREQALLDVWLDYPITSASARFSVAPALGHLGIRTMSVLRLVLPSGEERAFQYSGDPGRVELDPRWYQSAATFVRLGFDHILSGLDHLLFVFCLVIPIRRWRPLVAIVSAFTVAHSLTLATAAFGYAPTALWFPPLVETVIAASIVYMALENMLRDPEALAGRWRLAFGFGLVHGFGFSFALGESLQFAGSHLLTSLAAFNVGVELGQLLVLAAAVPLLAWVAGRLERPRALVIVLSALVAHSAWHWMTERGGDLLSYDLSVQLTPLELTLALLRLALLLVVATGVAWGLSGVIGRFLGPGAIGSSGLSARHRTDSM